MAGTYVGTTVLESDAIQAGLQPWIGPQGQVMKRLELHLTYTCPERCVFCSEEHRMQSYRPFQVTWGRVATVLRKHAARGIDSIHITGGEPTIHPRFIDVLRMAKKLGMRTSVGTIGTMLSKRDFAVECLPWLDEALFSIHGPDAQTHDMMTRREGSFDQVTEALRLSTEIKPEFNAFVNTVMTRYNVDKLPGTVALVEKLGAKLIIVSNTTPEGNAFDVYKDLAVPLADLKRILPNIPPILSKATVRFFGVPMCMLGDFQMYSNDLHWDPRVTVEWRSEPGKVLFDGIYSWAPDRRRLHPDECEPCTLKKVCMGVYDKYAELWPTVDLAPQLGAPDSSLAAARP